jgi:site-specific DNA-methyltransferase (adenine-specific)
MSLDLMHGDCLELMKQIPDNSIDMVLTDPPYGTTACKWDTVIDFEPMWEQLKRITKDNGAICLFGSEPFSSALRMSNIKMFKYDWVWEKPQPSNSPQAKRRPLNYQEIISVFYKKQCAYYPIKTKGKPNHGGNKGRIGKSCNLGFSIGDSDVDKSGMKYPRQIIRFNQKRQFKVHPTQKPVALLEYLIKTYTLENETVLDFTMGSGSTGVACKNLNRKFIGIEKDDKYFNIAKERILS